MIKSPTKEIRAVDNHQGHENGRLGKKKKKRDGRQKFERLIALKVCH